MREVQSDCIVTFEMYQELNPSLKGGLEEYKLITKLDDMFLDFVMGLY